MSQTVIGVLQSPWSNPIQIQATGNYKSDLQQPTFVLKHKKSKLCFLFKLKLITGKTRAIAKNAGTSHGCICKPTT
jgi:hypothetical protein